MRIAFILLVFLLSHSQIYAQTNNPLAPLRNNIDICGTSDTLEYNKKTMEMLPADKYPWGVCHSWYADFSQKEIEWTREAMRIWNINYLDYVWRRWGTLEVVNIPTGDLFVESCDSDKYNILYTWKEHLSGALAYYSP